MRFTLSFVVILFITVSGFANTSDKHDVLSYTDGLLLLIVLSLFAVFRIIHVLSVDDTTDKKHRQW